MGIRWAWAYPIFQKEHEMINGSRGFICLVKMENYPNFSWRQKIKTQTRDMLWTEVFCAPKIHMLKLYFPVQRC